MMMAKSSGNNSDTIESSGNNSDTIEADDGPSKPPSLSGDGQGPRKVGPPEGETVPPVPSELLDEIKDAETVEIAFSDGENEIAGLAPLAVAADANWKISGAGLLLASTVELHGPGFGQPPYQLAGYGLFLDGELITYKARGDVVPIGANMTVRLENDIVF